MSKELLLNFKLNKITYIVIKVVEAMQLVYIFLRSVNEYQWNFSSMAYVSVLLNFMSLDNILRNNPAIFVAVLLCAIAIMSVMVGLGVIVGVYAGEERVPTMVRVAIPILNLFLYLFKTVLAIPLLVIALISLVPQISNAFKITTISVGISALVGIFLIITFILVQLYLLYIYREPNPFSEMPHAGETFAKALMWLIFKVLIVFAQLLDMKGTWEGPLDIFFTILVLLLIFYSHYDTGVYKIFERILQIRIQYILLVVGLLQAIDFYFTNSELGSFCYLLPLLILLYLLCQWVISFKDKRVAILNVVLNDKPEALQAHIIYLIELIDNLQKKENRIKLEGYMQYHRRDCRLGLDCPCSSLVLLRQHDQQIIKMQYFKLIVFLLQQGQRRFPNFKQFNLFLVELYHYRIKNPLQAMYALSKTVEKDKFQLLDRLYLSYFSHKVELDLEELQEEELGKAIYSKKYMDYTNKMVIFEQHIQTCTKNHIEFWRLMLDSNPEIKRLQDLGTLITRSKDSLKEQFESISIANPNSVQLLLLYGKFLLQVTNEEAYNVKYLQKAENILKVIKQSSKIDDKGDKYSENSQTVLIVISGDEGSLGSIVHTNNLVKNLLGYKRVQLLQRNVSLIMPKIFGDNHNAILSRFTSASTSKVNGRQRIVPALRKDGYMLPVTALSKTLPTLTSGIQIVGYLAKLEEEPAEQDEQIVKVNYILYRTDNEQVLGISQGCYYDYHINPCLVYGNAYNLNNQLRIKNIFGVSFQRSDDGKIASALEVGEVLLQLNTKGLKDEFIISRPNASNQDIIAIQQDQCLNKGVEMEVAVRCKLSIVYFGVTLKLITLNVQETRTIERIPSRKHDLTLVKQKTTQSKKNKKRSLEQSSRIQSDQVKNLKEFKNFISIKSEPRAITALGAICICLILILIGCILGLIFNWTQVSSINKNILALYHLNLNTEIATPQLMSKLEQEIISISANSWGITNFPSATTVNSDLNLIIDLAKHWLLKLLPYKYYFDSNYNQLTSQYNYNSKGNINTQQKLLQQTVTNYISYIDTLTVSNLSVLANSTSFTSNLYEQYSSAKITQIYSLRAALNASNTQAGALHQSMLQTRRKIIISINSLMIAAVIIWIILLLPYILSVTKINNRVLSLFTLIPYPQICRLIYCCLSFMNKNLAQAAVSQQDLQFYQNQQLDDPSNLNESNINSPQSNLSGILSPSNHGLILEPYTQSSLVKRSDIRRRGEGAQSAIGIEQRFEKIISSKDRNRKGIIMKFVVICLAIIAFILFYLLYSLGSITTSQNNLYSYFLLGRRPALVRNIKLLLEQYLLNPLFQPPSFVSIKTLNSNIIQQSYTLEANLLFLDLGASQSLFNNYNNGDVCAAIPNYSSLAIFQQSMTSAECYWLKSGVLQKGLQTAMVSVLQDIRLILSAYPSTVSKDQLTSKVLQYEALVKYIETPMLAVLSAVQSNTQSINQVASLVIYLAGGLFILLILVSWQLLWRRYLNNLNVKIWRTKGLLNLIPMRIITSNELLKNEFTCGQLQSAVR